MGAPIPNPSSTPRPKRYLIGLYPNKAMCPGPLPGVIPGRTGVLTPQELLAANLSRFGNTAASNSDWPVEGFVIPPRPSTTIMTIFEAVCFLILDKYWKSIIIP